MAARASIDSVDKRDWQPADDESDLEGELATSHGHGAAVVRATATAAGGDDNKARVPDTTHERDVGDVPPPLPRKSKSFDKSKSAEWREVDAAGHGTGTLEPEPDDADTCELVSVPDDNEEFSVTRRPTRRLLWELAQHELVDEDGNTLVFGQLYPDWPDLGPEPPLEDGDDHENEHEHENENELENGYENESEVGHERGNDQEHKTEQAHEHERGRKHEPENKHEHDHECEHEHEHEHEHDHDHQHAPDAEVIHGSEQSAEASSSSSAQARPSQGSASSFPLAPNGRPRQTVVFFVRTIACGQCQDYVRKSVARIDPEVVEASNVSVYLITNGNWKGVKRYRELMKCPFPVYVDAKVELYKKLGMSPKIGQLARIKSLFKDPHNPRAPYHQHAPLVQSFHGFVNLARMGVATLGDPDQVGGEFILRPGYDCVYTHRMTSKYDHALAVDVLRAAGVRFPEYRQLFGPLSSSDHFTDKQLAAISEQEKQVNEWRLRKQTSATVTA